MKNTIITLSSLILLISCNNTEIKNNEGTQLENSIGIIESNEFPGFWQYNGEPLLLLGGSNEDNLFQIENLTEELDLLAAAGGNYVRNTMSSRDEDNLWPFEQNEDGLFDLTQWNDDYWVKFETLLRETSQRDIVVQIEVWATFDFYRDNWDINPWNPKNNVNYDYRRTKLTETVETHPIYAENNFFRSVPSQMALMRLLDFQQAFVDKILSHSLKYDNVLYCMDNETSVTSDWGKFWANYIQKTAMLQDKKVYTTEMWDPWDLNHVFHLETLDNPDIFNFVDISQNNHQTGDNHWNNALDLFERLKKMETLRPVNNIKIYGNDGGRHKTTRNATENFVKNVLLGCASARFHRPNSGQGLNEHAQTLISTMRQLTDSVNHFEGRPANELLSNRSDNEAFCRAIENREYIIFFPKQGDVDVDLSEFIGTPNITWINLMSGEWSEIQPINKNNNTISTPDDDYWIALIR